MFKNSKGIAKIFEGKNIGETIDRFLEKDVIQETQQRPSRARSSPQKDCNVVFLHFLSNNIYKAPCISFLPSSLIRKSNKGLWQSDETRE